MAEIEWIFICEYAIIDKANKLSMLGEFTSIFFREFPSTFPVIYVVSRWTGEQGETFTGKIRFINPDGERIAEAVLPVVEIKSHRSTNLSKFELLHFNKPGEYIVEAYSNDKLISIFGPQRSNSLWSRDTLLVRGSKNTKEPTLKVLGITGGMVGSHPDIIVLDDITDKDNSKTEHRRKTL